MARFVVAQRFGLALDDVLAMGVVKFAAHLAFLQLQNDASRAAS